MFLCSTIVVCFQGFRLSASSLLPLTRDSLVYGSADQGSQPSAVEPFSRPACFPGRTTHFDDAKCNTLMEEAAGLLNLKPHFAGANRRKKISSCVDVEVHKASDGNLYLLDAAR